MSGGVGGSETVPVKETASDDIAKQPKGIHESAVTPQGLHYDAMHNARGLWHHT